MIEIIVYSFVGGAALTYIIWYLADIIARYTAK